MKFNYVQIGAKDISKLTKFYEKALDFEFEKGRTLPDGKAGVIMSAPGFKDEKVLFGFYEAKEGKAREINDRGFAHICFESVDVKACIKRWAKYGGTFYSTLEKPENAPCVYCKDIEGNIVEFHIPFDNKLQMIGGLLHLTHDKAIRKEIHPSGLKFIHVNIITEDWRGLCNFYNTVVKSNDYGKIKDHSGSFKEKVIGVEGVHVIGKHILLPDFYNTYPTLEIFTYSIKGTSKVSSLNERGINLIGFKSDNIDDDIKLFTSNGGKLVEKVSEKLAIVTDINGGLIYLNK